MNRDLELTTIEVEAKGSRLRIPAWRRVGEGAGTLLYLHGLGSSSADFLPAVREPQLDAYTLVAFDYPGTRNAHYPEEARLGVEDVAAIAWSVAEALAEGPITLVGHSLGGAVGLLAAERHAGRVTRFVNVEGNLAAEDCFLVRPLAEMDDEAFEEGDLLRGLAARYAESALLGDRVWADAFRSTVAPSAFRDYGRSLVALSDDGDLLRRFLDLPVERVFVHGEANVALPYLAALEAGGVAVVAVPGCGHWPLYEQPERFLQVLCRLLDPSGSRPRTFDAHAVAREATGDWRNVAICGVDGHVVRLSVLARDFHWHHHASDEVLFVLEGQLAVDLEDRTEELGPGQGILLPAGVRHRTRGAPRAVNLAFESATLDVRGVTS